MLHNLLKKHQSHIWVVCRVIVGLLFWSHGAQKLLGIFGGTAAPAFTRMWVAGVIEFFGGLLITVGLLTQVVAALSALYMLVVYFIAHASKALLPIINKGELALLYFAIFLAIAAYGAGPFALDNIFAKKKKHKG